MSTLTSLSGSQLTMAMANDGAPALHPGSPFSLPLIVTNAGARGASWGGDKPLNVAYRWLDARGATVDGEGRRTPLGVQALAPGESTSVKARGFAPPRTGRYSLQLSLVLEGVHWACDVAPDGWLQLDVVISEPPAWPEGLRGSPGGRALRGALAASEVGRLIDASTFSVNLAAREAASADRRREADRAGAGWLGAIGRRLRKWGRPGGAS